MLSCRVEVKGKCIINSILLKPVESTNDVPTHYDHEEGNVHDDPSKGGHVLGNEFEGIAVELTADRDGALNLQGGL